MKIKIFTLLLLFVFVISGNGQISKTPNKYDMSFTRLANSWDEAIPLGNGILGSLVWQKDGKLRFSIDRSDVWDNRPMDNLDREEFSFDWVYKRWKKKRYSKVQRLFDDPYDKKPAPSKIPVASLEFDVVKLGKVKSVKLYLNNALCEVTWENGAVLNTFVKSDEKVSWFRFDNLPSEISPELVMPKYASSNEVKIDGPVEGQDLRRLGYTQGKLIKTENKVVYNQKCNPGYSYSVVFKYKSTDNSLEGNWTINTSDDDKPKLENTNTDFDSAYKAHQVSWSEYWNKTSINIPNSILEKQWYWELYKFGSVTGNNASPISLQAIWTADNGKLPPWKGDLHHDLNTQLSYWPSYSGNHLEREIGFIDWMVKYKEKFKSYTKEFYGTDGLAVPGVSTVKGDPMGGWIQYAFSPTVGAWLGQNFYWHWRYSMDREFLVNYAYPWLKDVAIHFEQLAITDKKGNLKLPLSSSPEVNGNDRDAWFSSMTNYDLALVKWTFIKASELATELGKEEEAKHWKDLSARWGDFDLDKTGTLTFAKDNPYNHSHRHFSNLLAIHPLGVIDVNNGEEDRKIIESSIKTLEKYGPDYWTGYSYSWFGNIKARAKDGEGAMDALETFATCFCLKNGFHVNGDQSNTGKSTYTYKPFTLEGNFAFASGVQEMLLQSHAGYIEVFPAIPVSWEVASFNNMLAQGAFEISAERRDDILYSVKVVSKKGGILKLKNTFRKHRFICNKEYKLVGDLIVIETAEGDVVEFKRD